MKALVFERTGNPSEVLSLRQLADPKAGAGEVLVRVLLSPAHPSDLHVVRGRFGRQPVLPASPGSECVGVIETLGEGVSTIKVGTRVVLLDVPGTWRELVACPAERAVPVPDAISDEDASQAMVNPMTAWVLTMMEHKLRRGDSLVQSAAGSTVGRLVLQLSKSEGFQTVNLVRRQDQVEEIEALGGGTVICTADDEWPDQLAKSTLDMGIHSAIDCVAGRIGATIARTLAPGGRLLVYGALSTHQRVDAAAFEMPIFAPHLIYSAVDVQGWFLYHWFSTHGINDTRGVLENVLRLMADGVLALPASKRFPISRLSDALAAIEANSVQGKVLLDFTDQ